MKAVLTLVVDDSDVLLDRVKGRMVHLESGRSYSDTNPPKVPGKDDETGEVGANGSPFPILSVLMLTLRTLSNGLNLTSKVE